jgi:dihydrofolate reductase
MSAVFVDVGVSLDGFVAGPNARPGNPLGDGGLAIHAWMFATATFRRVHGSDGGETGPDDDLVQRVFARAGAYVIGRRMFDEGEVAWPEAPPFRAPVFVLTHRTRAPWVRQGGTTFHFVTDGFAAALAHARAAAGARDVRVCGGADVIRQALAAGVVDDFTLHTAPVLLGQGRRLFDGNAPPVEFAPATAAAGARAHHLHFRVRPRAAAASCSPIA